ncbi:MAG: bifunctional phosphopantothenoylcysteine decarboxylase/phosphopantothenate--cysteine ligase CoaBC [Bdellovibrionales bacterium]
MSISLKDKSILLVISGGIAAYKSLELIRLIKKAGGNVRCILTNGGAQFVTPLSVAALSENGVYTDLWSLKDETEMGHIRLSREADLIVIAPASANIIAQMAYGLADDLASTTLLANHDTPVLLAPAMNHAMWVNAATQDNIQTLINRGVSFTGPEIGAMACNEYGPGRMSEPEQILSVISHHPLIASSHHLKGLKALVTSGPTHEPIDPVRFIGNRSSGKQGHAIAEALAQYSADVTLISGPVNIPDPRGVNTIHVQTAQDMLNACESALPADIAICAAAVSDWAPETAAIQKIKKCDGQSPPTLTLKENQDILKTLSTHKLRPRLVIGFAAETQNLLDNARAKLQTKSCDWILANNVAENVFGAEENHVYLITQSETQDWQTLRKTAIAQKLAEAIKDHLKS